MFSTLVFQTFTEENIPAMHTRLIFFAALCFVLSTSAAFATGPSPDGFTVTPQTDHAEISWYCTASPQLDFFVIEKSTDGVEFNGVDTIAYAITEQEYQTNDYNPIAGRSYYRLKSVFVNGEVQTTRIVALNFSTEIEFGFSVFPTPATEKFSLIFKGVGDSPELIYTKVLNLRGKTIATFQIPPGEVQTNAFCVNSCNTLFNPGTYVVVSTHAGKASWQKLVIE